jgi:mannose-6-phosphate isomerase-like protein (cupin superfamily)
MPVQHVVKPIRIPVPGGKIIDEHVGRVSTETSGVSVAHMIAPAGWSEPAQKPAFDEVTLMLRGAMRVDTEEGSFTVKAGQSILVPRGITVTYSNPFAEESEYVAVCSPAFSVDAAGRA